MIENIDIDHKLTGKTKEIVINGEPVTFYQIRAAYDDINGNFKEGDIGGYISNSQIYNSFITEGVFVHGTDIKSSYINAANCFIDNSSVVHSSIKMNIGQITESSINNMLISVNNTKEFKITNSILLNFILISPKGYREIKNAKIVSSYDTEFTPALCLDYHILDLYDNYSTELTLLNNIDYTSPKDIFIIEGTGSCGRRTIAYMWNDVIYVNCGCFNGTLDDFAKQIEKTYGSEQNYHISFKKLRSNMKFYDEYRSIVDLILYYFHKRGVFHV